MGTRRLLGGLGVLLFFAAFFALPLYAAATICTMACCHHAPSVSMTTAEANGCSTECSIRSGVAADAAQAKTLPAPNRTTHHATTAATSVNISAFRAGNPLALDSSHHAPPGGTALHILHTVFRI